MSELTLYCKIWRTRKEIREKFDMSNMSSWNLVKFIGKLKTDFIVQKRMGATGRAYMYRSRKSALDKISV